MIDSWEVIEVEVIVWEVNASSTSSLACMRTVNSRSESSQYGVQLSAGDRIAVGSVPASIWNAAHECHAVVEVTVAANISAGCASCGVNNECVADLLNNKRSCSLRNIESCTEIKDGQIEADYQVVAVEGEESGLSQIVKRLIGTVEEEIYSHSHFVSFRN